MKDHFSQKQPFTLRIYNSLPEVAKEWDHFLPDHHSLKSPFLLATESAALEGIRFRYIMVEINRECVGLVYFQLLKISNQSLGANKLLNENSNLIGQFLLTHGINLAICGHLFRNNFTGFYFKKPTNNHLVFSVLDSFSKLAPAKLKPDVAIVKECDSGFNSQELKANSFQPFNQDFLYTFPVKQTWKQFDDYVQNLSSKYQKRAIKVRKNGQMIERKWLNEEQISKHIDQIEALYLEVVNKQVFKPATLNAAYLFKMKHVYGDRFQILGYFDQERLCGFASYIVLDNNKIELHYVGFSEKDNESFSLYFNMLFDGVELAIQKCYSHLHLGRTGKDAKSSLGAFGTNANNYFKVKRSVKGWFITCVLNLMIETTNQQGPERNPFKEQVELKLA